MTDNKNLKMARELLQGISMGSLIGTEIVNSETMIEVENPYSGKIEYSVSSATDEQISFAIEAASSVSNKVLLGNTDKIKVLNDIANLIDSHREELSLLESFDTGRCISTVRGWDIDNAIGTLRFYAGLVGSYDGDVLTKSGSVMTFTIRKPIGVCLAILPWNFPFVCLIWKIAPALAAGCPLIVKTSENTPLSALLLQKLLVENSTIPKGYLQIIHGGKNVGKQLIRNARFDRISLTGSCETGIDVAISKGNPFARLSFELGGKSAFIVTDRADIEAASGAAVGAAFGQQGQDCGAASLLFVHAKVYSEFKETFVQKVIDTRVIGSQLEPDTNYGPLINSEHKQVIEGYIEEGIKMGGKNLLEGKFSLPDGNFVAPVIFENLTMDEKISNLELFGPITILIPYEDPHKVANDINSMRYGLWVSIWDSESDAALAYCNEIDVRNYWINTYGVFDHPIPWGGLKQSGTGGDNGVEAYLDHLVSRVVSIG